ncbi:conserved hypothetical protein [uncultured Stenotrophomonas sp.]|uniref:DUF4357 domain-containing protein n=1 Tax=uncultured Stenotrophomonas sp. TaxID=165438 RepID=A0A1Y5Q7I4_9GAMM|nr:conserved hypothetical protein [uncultured Stenotrophomonas sp.]
MNHHPQTIQIFLPKGDPQGIRIAEITTRIVRVIEIPRSLMHEFIQMPESEQVGVYFLFGEDENTGRPLTYIGQTGQLKQRLLNHSAQKDFWDRAVVAVSLTHSLTNTHAIYLEWRSIQHALAAHRYDLQNSNTGGQPYTPAPMEADCQEIHQTIRVLLATLGYPLFEPLSRSHEMGGLSVTTYYCRGPDTDGLGEYTTEGMVVKKGSHARLEHVDSYSERSRTLREELIAQGIVVASGKRLRFENDYAFKSPSAASSFLLGRPSNGWSDWKDSSGRTLDAVERVPLHNAEAD